MQIMGLKAGKAFIGARVAMLLALAIFSVSGPAAKADSVSYVGTLADPESFISETVTLAAASDVTLQTYGFGGGTNQAGTLIAPGGTDPFVGLFSGTGDSALFINGASLNANYTPFAGCPPANTVSNFGATTCGDITMTFDDLAAGTYTVILSDGQYLADAAVGIGSTLGDGFTDLTGGVFCNAADFTNGVETDCPNTSGAYALDVLTTSSNSGGTNTAPEPSTLLLLGASLVSAFGVWRFTK